MGMGGTEGNVCHIIVQFRVYIRIRRRRELHFVGRGRVIISIYVRLNSLCLHLLQSPNPIAIAIPPKKSLNMALSQAAWKAEQALAADSPVRDFFA